MVGTKIAVSLQLRGVRPVMQSTFHFSPHLCPHPAHLMQDGCKLEEELAREQLFIPDLQQQQGRGQGLLLQYGKALFVFHCCRVFQFGFKSVVYQPWSKAAVSLAVCTSIYLFSSFVPVITSHILSFPLCYFHTS